MHDQRSSGYMIEIDGLRAIALIGVMLVHLYIPGFSLGWAGVNLFFVISGFLITGILLDNKQRSHYFRNFYARRALRIFPIYYLSLFVVFAIAVILRQQVQDIGYYLTYTQNYLLALTNFVPAFPILYNHTWTLAVEEQFYFVWPLAVFWFNPPGLLRFLIATFFVALLARVMLFLALGGHYLLYTALPVHVDALAAGGMLAVLVRLGVRKEMLRVYGRWVCLGSAIGLVLLVYATGIESFWDAAIWTARPWNVFVFSFMALFFQGLIAQVVWGNATWLAWLLRHPALVAIGKISYGMYLYHFPIFRLLDYISAITLPQRVALIAAKVFLTYVVALMSWHLVEVRCNSLKKYFV